MIKVKTFYSDWHEVSEDMARKYIIHCYKYATIKSKVLERLRRSVIGLNVDEVLNNV